MANDQIIHYKKHKGFMSIPRELLQDKNLSLEAIGLLCNIASYPDTWVLYKNQLISRFEHNGKHVVSRAWDELVKNNYIVQFRKRDGKQYKFRYFFETTPFDVHDIQEMSLNCHQDGFVLYHKDMKQEKFKVADYREYVFCENKEILDFGFWESADPIPKECDITNVSWESGHGIPTMGLPSSDTIKLNIKEINYKDKNNNIYTSDQVKIYEDVFSENQQVDYAYKFLSNTGLDQSIIIDISKELMGKPYLVIPELIVEQTKHNNDLVLAGKMYSYANYFIKGLEMRYSGYQSKVSTDSVDKYYSEALGLSEYDGLVIPIGYWDNE